MPRKRDRKVLYEVTMQALKQKNSGSRLEKTFRKRAFRKKKSEKTDKFVEKAKVSIPKRNVLEVFVSRLLKLKPPMVLKISAVAAVVIVGMFIFGGDGDNPAGQSVDTETTGVSSTIAESETEVGEIINLTGGNSEKVGEGDGSLVEVPGPPKDHKIIIASYKNESGQLIPVGKYFADNGIETEIEAISDGWFRLVTKERFVKPGDPLSQIASQKKLISEVGKGYKPPDGFLTFEFGDVYSVKVND